MAAIHDLCRTVSAADQKLPIRPFETDGRQVAPRLQIYLHYL